MIYSRSAAVSRIGISRGDARRYASPEGTSLSFCDRDVRLIVSDALVRRAHDAVAACQLFYTVRAPARDAGCGKYRRGEVKRDVQRVVNEAGVKVYVCRQNDI